MLPIELKFKGLFSYQQEAIIDFKTLTANGLFGIFGSVGSGKSTILDAITLALYGNTDRLGNTNSFIMNLSSNELSSEFTFSLNEKKYRFKVEYKRNKDGQVNNAKHIAYLLEGKDWVPKADKTTAVKAYAEDLLELSVENFKRTVIIPQGKFSEFLTLQDSKRLDMVTELFNLNRFDYSNAIKALTNATTTDLNVLSGQLITLGEVSEEEIATLKQSISALNQKLKGYNEAIEKQQKIVTQQENARQWQKEFEKLNAEWEAIQKEEPAFQTLKADYLKFLNLKNKFSNLVNELTSKKEEFQNREHKLKNAEAALALAKDNLQTVQRKQAEIVGQTPKYDYNKILQQDLPKAVRIKSLNLEIEDLNQKATKFQEWHSSITAEIEKLNQDFLIQEQEIEVLKEQLAPREALNQALNRKEKIATQKAKVEDLGKEVANLKVEFTKAEQSLLAHKNSTLISQLKGELQLPESDSVVAVISSLVGNLNTLKEKKEKLNWQNRFSELAANLKAGEPCDLCGSLHHPAPAPTSETISKELLAVNNSISNIDSQLRELKEINQQIQIAERLLEEKERQLKALQVKLQAEENNYNQNLTLEATLESGTLSLEEVNTLLANFKEIDTQVASKETLIKQKRIELDSRKDKLKSGAEKHQVNQGKLTSASATSAELISQLQNLKPEEFANRSTEDLQEQLGQILKEISVYEAEKSVIELLLSQAEKDLAMNESAFSSAQAEFKIAQTNFNKTEELLNISLLKEGGLTYEHVILELGKEADFQGAEENIQAHENKKTATTAKLEAHLKQKPEFPFEEDALNVAKEKLDTLTNEKNEALTKLGVFQNTLDSSIERFEKRTKLLADEKVKKERLDQLNELEKILGKRKFINFVSTNFLEQIVRIANNRFYTLSNNELKLGLSASNDFEIIDYLNEGKIRSPKTLSGGQTFQAALCLALALSEVISGTRGGRQQFFFLDEGFGSLDENALQLVITTLRKLQQEGRVVGLISHVEGMKQLTPAYLEAQLDPQTGSRLKLVNL